MLQIRLSKGSSADTATATGGGGGGGAASVVGPPPAKAAAVGPGAAEGVMVACPDHLVIADLPVAKSIGAVTASSTSAARTIGRRSRRPLGERVHICSRCDFPIAIYGRLTPCEHAFCLTCARSDSSCYLCDERIQKIQSVKMMEGIFICAAPHCLKSFLKKSDFEAHIHDAHANLLDSSHTKEGPTESDVPKDATLKPESSTARGPARQLPISPTSSQINDPESRRAHLQRENTLSKPKSSQSEQVITPEKMESPFIYPPLPPHQPNFGMGVNMNQQLLPPQAFGNQQFFPNPYQVQLPDGGPDPGSLLGMPPSPWGMGLMGMPVQQQMQMGHGSMEGVGNPMDPAHGIAFLQGMHGDNSGDNKNILANLQMQFQMPMSIPPPQMPPSSMQQHFSR
ncbi:hypothetical protein LUZ63_010834 [Rhynchospora breviuscula]|uniref:RING-type E3 ubiquitin transferase n=1 Tax=Rhynchospora breviuscula TaxID=2022672 RepID=A0A9Q0HPW2_9POAL|nr:hypothetical protein LUZ63_010834 [Rhynchospora breviuscula]